MNATKGNVRVDEIVDRKTAAKVFAGLLDSENVRGRRSDIRIKANVQDAMFAGLLAFGAGMAIYGTLGFGALIGVVAGVVVLRAVLGLAMRVAAKTAKAVAGVVVYYAAEVAEVLSGKAQWRGKSITL